MRIGKKLTMGFVGIALLIGVVGYIGFNSNKRINESAHTIDMAHHAYEKIAKLEAIVLDQVHEGMHLLSFEEEACIEAFKKLGEDFRKQLKETKITAAAPELQEKFLAIEASHEKFEKMFNEVVKAHYAGQLATKEQRHDMHKVWCPVSDEVIELTKGLQPLYTEMIEEAHKKSEKVIVSTTRNIISISIVGLFLAIILGYFITKSISNPITKLRDVTVEIGKGDLSKRAEIKSKDEIGELADSFNKMADEIQKRNEELQTMNEELRSSNEELNTSNEELQSTTEELEAANEEIRTTQEELVQKEKLAAVGQLASGVGHELRNPLGVIKNAAYYIKKSKIGTADPKLAKHLDIMEREINNSNKIISDLLNFSQTRLPELIPADVNEVIEEAMSVANIPGNVLVNRNLTSGLPKPAIDRDQIKQVFLNMMLNACQAMPQGGELKISSRLHKAGLKIEGQAKDCLEIEFADTGTGIAPGNLKKIFDPFFTTKAKGIGLGLAVSKGIIEKHQGDIEIKSELNKGATFIIKLSI